MCMHFYIFRKFFIPSEFLLPGGLSEWKPVSAERPVHHGQAGPGQTRVAANEDHAGQKAGAGNQPVAHEALPTRAD